MASTSPSKSKVKTKTTRPRSAADSTDAISIENGPALQVRREGRKIWSHVRHEWRVETPEELVRQSYVCVLVNDYGYSLEQIAEELSVTGRGSAQARADLLVWRSVEDKRENRPPLIVVECKADNVTISLADYEQGDHYARMVDAPFFVTHNTRETRYWRVRKDRLPGYFEEIENIPHANDSQAEIDRLIKSLKIFKEDEFARLLHECHNVIRNREKKDPAAAFDEIAKILFIKVWVERELREKRRRQNIFSVDFLDEQLGDDPLGDLFEKTKRHYAADKIFAAAERINLKKATGRELVRLLERYNLSDTSEDIKGIAFERFLGKTFRGDIGGFFTPRTVVEFMIRMIEPQEGDIICDPACGSGGFLIRFFELVREQILADIDRQYHEAVAKIESDTKLSDDEKAERRTRRFKELQAEADKRLWHLANRCVYGTDANDRMARTGKMNMIMHGDGHGGVHHHDGFLNINGIFEERFHIVLANPPFGANVEPSDVVLPSDGLVSPEAEDRYRKEYGQLYEEAQARVRNAEGKPIASLFRLPRNAKSKVKTEILFIERCLTLLQPGGRLGIVLPEGIFNNPSLRYVRDFCEDRAFIRAVVSLPSETFLSAGATVKTSLLFLQKFTAEEQARFDQTAAEARREREAWHGPEIKATTKRLQADIEEAKAQRDSDRRRELERELKDYLKQKQALIEQETRKLLKERFSYPIFLYEAEKAGITATGEPDQNELYPNDNLPPELEKTCLEHYREFRRNALQYILPKGSE